MVAQRERGSGLWCGPLGLTSGWRRHERIGRGSNRRKTEVGLKLFTIGTVKAARVYLCPLVSVV